MDHSGPRFPFELEGASEGSLVYRSGGSTRKGCLLPILALSCLDCVRVTLYAAFHHHSNLRRVSFVSVDEVTSRLGGAESAQTRGTQRAVPCTRRPRTGTSASGYPFFLFTTAHDPSVHVFWSSGREEANAYTRLRPRARQQRTIA